MLHSLKIPAVYILTILFFFPNHSLFCSLFVFVCFRHSDGYMVFYWGFNLHSPMTNEVKQLFFLFWPLDSLFCKVCLNCLPIFLFCYHFIDLWEFFILNAGHLLVMCLTNIMSHFISYLLILLMESLMKTNFKSQYSIICHFFLLWLALLRTLCLLQGDKYIFHVFL